MNAYNEQYERDFNRDSKAKNWQVLPKIDGCDLNVGDIVTFTNTFGVSFEGLKVLGFCDPSDDSRKRCVYLSFDCYWFPVGVSELKREKSPAAQKVLALMDEQETPNYFQALKQVLESDTSLIRLELENELNYYI